MSIVESIFHNLEKLKGYNSGCNNSFSRILLRDTLEKLYWVRYTSMFIEVLFAISPN